MFNPHIHHQQQQQQQQQQFHQHLRQIQQLFQQQPPPPPPQPPPQHHVQHHHHHHQAQRPMPSQTAPTPRMVNLCQATQTTIIAPNPMLQGALLMQQMQGNMRGFAMGGQQFRQFFSAGARSSLLGPVPMGMTMKSPLMGFPAARHYHPHHRFYNNNINASTSTDYRQPDRKRDNEQRASGSANGQSAASITADTSDKVETGGAAAAGGEAGESTTAVVDLTDEPAVKKARTEGSEEPAKEAETVTLDSDNTADDADCTIVEEVGSTAGSEVLEGIEETGDGDAELNDECLADDSVLEEGPEDLDAPAGSQDDQDDSLEGTNKFYCYLCSITCHSQQNFRSHMNGISHQQRMMEIQHMSNACLVTLLPRVQESLQAAHKDGEKRAEPRHWCPSCGIHLTCGATDHHCNKDHKLVGPTCTVCNRSFKSSLLFVEHMRSQEHKHRVEEEKQGFGALSGLSALDTEGLLRDHEDGSAVEGEERDKTQGSYKLDYLSSQTEVTLERMSMDEEYKTDTVYGSRFLVPVAGFLCRLCNKFYHFESSALHSHCKSLTHFEHLKKYKALKSSRQDGSPTASKSEDRLRPVSELECLDSTSNPAASGDLDLPEPPVVPQESPPTPGPPAWVSQDLTETSAADPLCDPNDLTGEEEEKKLLSQEPSDQVEPADALLAEEAPADALLAEEAPADALLAEEVPADALLAEEAPADALLAEETPTDALLAVEAPADALLAEEAPAVALLAEEAPAVALLAEEAPAVALLAEEAPAVALMAEEAPAGALLAEEAPADALLAEEAPAEEAAVEEEKEAPEKKVSTGKAKAAPKRRSRRR